MLCDGAAGEIQILLVPDSCRTKLSWKSLFLPATEKLRHENPTIIKGDMVKRKRKEKRELIPPVCQTQAGAITLMPTLHKTRLASPGHFNMEGKPQVDFIEK